MFASEMFDFDEKKIFYVKNILKTLLNKKLLMKAAFKANSFECTSFTVHDSLSFAKIDRVLNEIMFRSNKSSQPKQLGNRKNCL